MNVGKDMVDAFVAFIRPIFMEVVNAVTRIAKEVEEGIEKAIDGLEKVAKEVKGFGEDIEELMAKIKKVFGRRLLEDMDDEEREQLAREIIRTHIALLGKVERHTDKVRAKADNYVNVIERITLLELSKVHAALLGFNAIFPRFPPCPSTPTRRTHTAGNERCESEDDERPRRDEGHQDGLLRREQAKHHLHREPRCRPDD